MVNDSGSTPWKLVDAARGLIGGMMSEREAREPTCGDRCRKSSYRTRTSPQQCRLQQCSLHQAVQDWCSTVPPCGAESKRTRGLWATVLSTSGISEAELRKALGFGEHSKARY